jgi:O-succinylhomoserine sulfhydrylase
VERVYHPACRRTRSTAGHAQQSGHGGAVVSFVARGGREGAFHVIDSPRICSITANLGDTKTTITHPASTSHGRLSEAQRQAAGIVQGMIRLGVGLDDIEDLKADLMRGLATLNA